MLTIILPKGSLGPIWNFVSACTSVPVLYIYIYIYIESYYSKSIRTSTNRFVIDGRGRRKRSRSPCYQGSGRLGSQIRQHALCQNDGGSTANVREHYIRSWGGYATGGVAAAAMCIMPSKMREHKIPQHHHHIIKYHHPHYHPARTHTP